MKDRNAFPRFIAVGMLCFIASISAFGIGRLLIFKCNVQDADIYLNDQWRGRITEGKLFALEGLKAGDYRLSVRKDGYLSHDQIIQIQDGLDTPISEVNLRPIKSPPPPVVRGTISQLLIYTDVPDVEVRVDGRVVGSTGANKSFLWSVNLGRHLIRVQRSGYRSQEKTVVIDSELSRPIHFRMIEDDRISAVLIVILIVSLVALTGIALALSAKGSKRRPAAHTSFDRYVIMGILGRGGMATIYKARDSADGLMVALKIMDPGYLTDEDLVNKFMREGRAISEINSEYPEAPIVKVLRYGRENNRANGRPFIAMEILEGEDLLKLIRAKQKFSPHYAFSIAKQVASALKPAHSKGIYHRDVTPDNIIVIRNNPNNPVVRLIDFGVARHEYTSAGTLDGSISGKPPYMSPEQCRGEKVDGRSDIYSLGIILYTLIMGNPPFISNNPLEVMKHHEKTPVSPITLDIDGSLKSIIYKMLEKDRSRRYLNIDALLADLNKVEA